MSSSFDPQGPAPSKRALSPVHWVGIVVVLAALVGGAAFFILHLFEAAKAAENRHARVTPVIAVVAPAPLPSGPPLVGDPAARAPDGYPTQYVDKAAVRSMLWHGEMSELTRTFEQIYDAAFAACLSAPPQ